MALQSCRWWGALGKKHELVRKCWRQYSKHRDAATPHVYGSVPFYKAFREQGARPDALILWMSKLKAQPRLHGPRTCRLMKHGVWNLINQGNTNKAWAFICFYNAWTTGNNKIETKSSVRPGRHLQRRTQIYSQGWIKCWRPHRTLQCWCEIPNTLKTVYSKFF